MGHHYVPQYLLRGFVEDGGVWCFDTKLETARKASLKSVANETNMYGAALEMELANAVESPANAVIDALRAGKAISEAEREVMARYIVVLWKRVPKARTRAAAHMPEVAEVVRREWHAAADQLLAEDPGDRSHLEARKGEIDQVIDKLSATMAPEAWLEGLNGKQSERVVGAVGSMNWHLLDAGSSQLLIGDDPVFIFRDRGVGHQNSQLVLPLSSRFALWCDRAGDRGLRKRRATSREVREINRRSVVNASRFIFAKQNDPWIDGFIRRWRLRERRESNA